MPSKLNTQAFNLLDMKTLAERLKSALSEAQISQSELGRRVGVSRSAVSLWLNGAVSELTGAHLLHVADALGVSVGWLSTGRGKRKPTEPQEVPFENNPEYPVIPRVKIKIQAGVSGFAIEPIADEAHAPIVFAKAWYERNGYIPRALICIRVNGASMEPSLFDGDWVVINTADVAPRDGVAFAVNFEGEAVIKRLFRSDAGWIAASDNADKRIYRDRPITDDSFVIGRVVHKQSERI